MNKYEALKEKQLHDEFEHNILLFKGLHASYSENKLLDEQVTKMFKLYEKLSDSHGKYSKFIVGGDMNGQGSKDNTYKQRCIDV